MFDLEGTYISKFGKQENKDEEFDFPRYLSVINKQGFLRIFDSENLRVQVFELSGKFVAMFGSGGYGKGEFRFPNSSANLCDGSVVVCDTK